MKITFKAEFHFSSYFYLYKDNKMNFRGNIKILKNDTYWPKNTLNLLTPIRLFLPSENNLLLINSKA